MPNIIPIQSIDQPELYPYTRLTENQLRSRLEPEKGIFIAQTSKVIQYALEQGYEPLSMLAEQSQLTGQAQSLLELAGDIPVYTADEALLKQLTGYSLTRGMLCAMKRPALPDMMELCKNAQRIAVMDGVVDATNVGAIMRSAAALDMDAVLVTTSCCDPFNRRAVRVSMGTVCQVPWTRICQKPSQWPEEGMEMLHRLGFKTAAMALCDDSVSIDDPDLLAEEKLAIVLGTEGDGLSSHTIADCDYTVRIPMSHEVDSLNVAAASAVAFWQMKAR